MAEIFALRAADLLIFSQRVADWQRYLHREQKIGRDIYTESRRLAEIFAFRAADWKRYLL